MTTPNLIEAANLRGLREAAQKAGAVFSLGAAESITFTGETFAEFCKTLAQVEQVPAELAGIAETVANGNGMWRECTGCLEREDGHMVGHYPYSEILKCALGSGCSECGGIGAIWDTTDYEAMADEMHAEMVKEESDSVTAAFCAAVAGPVLSASPTPPAEQTVSTDDACEVLSTVLHFIPATEPKLAQDVSALCHSLRADQPVSEPAPEFTEQFLCYAFGESDLPVAGIVRGRDGVKKFVIDEWTGADNDECADALVTFEKQDWAEEPTLHFDFEIGGIQITKVLAKEQTP